MTVSIPDSAKRDKIGVLLLHGFMSDLATVNGLVPHLEREGIEFEMPIMRGHGTRYQDLVGVTAKDWYADAEQALFRLSERVGGVVVVGLSMGGLVSLELAMRNPDAISGVAAVAACLKFADPLSRLTKVISWFVKFWAAPNSFNDLSLKVNCKNYTKFPTKTFASLYDYSKEIGQRLGEVQAPLRILQSKKDQITAPVAAELIYEGVGTAEGEKEIVWYERSGHEMMQDLEAEKVFEDIMAFVKLFRKG